MIVLGVICVAIGMVIAFTNIAVSFARGDIKTSNFLLHGLAGLVVFAGMVLLAVGLIDRIKA